MAFKHQEAYKLMNYRCKCGLHEMIWNSRDGVTPFTVPCPDCKDPMGMVHVDWMEDKFLPIYVPKKGDRFFVSMTKEKAREYAVRNVDHSISQGHIDERSRNSTIRRLTEDYYKDGQAPDIVEMG